MQQCSQEVGNARPCMVVVLGGGLQDGLRQHIPHSCQIEAQSKGIQPLLTVLLLHVAAAGFAVEGVHALS